MTLDTSWPIFILLLALRKFVASQSVDCLTRKRDVSGRTTMTALLILLLVCGAGLSWAEEGVAGSSNDQSESGTELVGPENGYIIAIFCYLVAFLMSFLAVLIGFYSILEDGLMREYLQQGRVHQASVLTADFIRAATTMKRTSCRNADPGQSEYLAYVEYRVIETDRKKTSIRKQVKAFASDFRTSTEAVSDIPHAIRCDIEFADCCLPTPSSGEMDSVVEAQEIEILVMSGYPRSGLPRSHVERASSLSFRLPTAGLVLFLVLMSGFCFAIGIHLSPSLLRLESVGSRTLAAATLASVVVVESLLIVACMGKGMYEGVREIYLEDGECTRISVDDTTISSADDSYLRL